MAGLIRLRVAALQLRQVARSRAYGSAAAAQRPHDYDNEECDFHGQSILRLELAGSPPRRRVRWVLMGDPGVKKHVYANKLSKLLEVPHISMGRLLTRELINPRSALYKQIANHVIEGKLVPENVIFALLSKRLEEGQYRGESGFILDGIPRTRIQAEILDQIVDVNLVVNFKCTEENLIKKNLESKALSTRNEFLSMGNSGFSTANATGAWKENFSPYEEQGKSLELHLQHMNAICSYYRKQRKLLDFQVAGAPGETWQGLLAALHLQHMNADGSSQKLTA